jgi:hypothetical protein
MSAPPGLARIFRYHRGRRIDSDHAHAARCQRYRYSAGADSEFESTALASERREKIRDRFGIVALLIKEVVDFGDSLSIGGFVVRGHAWTKSKCLRRVKQKGLLGAWIKARKLRLKSCQMAIGIEAQLR